MITIKNTLAFLLIVYAVSIPFFATDFYSNNQLTTIFLVLIALITSFLLYLERVVLFNSLIAFYVFTKYLTRPYVDIFHHKLDAGQLEYILGNDSYYNPAQAEVVYLSLLSLLISWAIGICLTKPKQLNKAYYPRLFKKFDHILFTFDWKSWAFIITVFVLSYQTPAELTRAFVHPETGEVLSTGKKLFLYGLISINLIAISCLAVFMFNRIALKQNGRFSLLFPVIFTVVYGTFAGGRGASYIYLVFVLLFWYFLNAHRNLYYKDLMKAVYIVLTIPIVLFFAMIAQSMKQFLNPRINFTFEDYLNQFLTFVNPFNPDNPLMSSVYFNLTELFHRLSHLQAQFIILNDQYINKPWDTFNPIDTFSRVVNDLVPGTVFQGVIGINKLFHHIYFDEFTTYSSHMWGIQGTLYLYFGFIFSPLVVFLIAILFKRYGSIIESIARISPSFYVFVSLLFLSFLENGTIERTIPVNIIRPLFTMVALILFIKILESLFPSKKTES